MKLKNKIIAISAATLALGVFGLTTGTIVKPETVQASSHSSFWSNPHHVVTTRAVYATEMYQSFKKHRDIAFRKKIVPAHTPLYLLYGAESNGKHCWAVMRRIPVKGIGNAYKSNGHYWCIPLQRKKWFRVVH